MLPVELEDGPLDGHRKKIEWWSEDYMPARLEIFMKNDPIKHVYERDGWVREEDEDPALLFRYIRTEEAGGAAT